MGKHLKEELEVKAIVNKIIKFSSVDGPGNRCVIFFQGCNFNCKYCHNPETINLCNSCGECISECETGALYFENKKVKWDEKKCIQCDNCIKKCKNNSSPKIKEMSVSDLLKEIEKVVDFIDGVTVSGGECTLNSIFITKLFIEIKKRWKNITCFIDTNGSLKFWKEENRELLDISDGIMLDIKNLNEKEHKNLTGRSNLDVVKNFIYLKKFNKLYEIRTVIYNEKVLETVEKVAKKIENNDVFYKIIKYRPFGVREKYKEELKIVSEDRIKETVEKYNIKKIIV